MSMDKIGTLDLGQGYQLLTSRLRRGYIFIFCELVFSNLIPVFLGP